MPKCPNCGQETARTMDWACQWCGYPLLSNAYEEIPKTYKQLKAEELNKQKSPELESDPTPESESELIIEPEPVPEPESELIIESDPTPEPESELIIEPEPTLEPESEIVLEPEPTPEPESEIIAELETKPTLELEPEPTPTEIGVTVEELRSTYRDKITADRKLTDKMIKITGIVDKIVVNDIHQIYYTLLTSTEKKEEQHVRCTFDKKYGSELDRLAIGQTVTVQGKYDGYRKNILMKDCVLVS